MKSKNKGFTLIELILYVGLIAVFLTGAIYYAWDVIYGREKTYQNQLVDRGASVAMARIAYEITNARDVVSVTPTQLVLQNIGSTTTIEVVGGRLLIAPGGAGPFFLTSNQLSVVNSDVFFDYSLSSSDSKNIRVKLAIEQSNSTVPGQPPATTELDATYELKAGFNQARSVLMDLTNANFVNPDITGIVLENVSNQDITVDKIEISWSETAGGENITGIQVGGGPVEWSGSNPTGSILDISDYSLTAGGGPVNVDYLSFDSDIASALVKVSFVMIDGSSAKGEFYMGSGGGGTPTPTPGSSPTATPPPVSSPTPTVTPPVYASCQQYCAGSGFTTGICLKNAGACSAAGYTYLGGGDPFCLGGPNADTCCCYR